MSRFLSAYRSEVVDPIPRPQYDEEPESDNGDAENQNQEVSKESSRSGGVGDYIDIQSRPYLTKILEKQGDRKVLFADKVLKFTSSGKIKKRILLITSRAIYIVDPETDVLKRRIALAAVEKVFLSELDDNFFAINVLYEYDVLMASTRKNLIVEVLVEVTRTASDYELEVSRSNSFEYNAAANLVKEIRFELVEGVVKTRILQK